MSQHRAIELPDEIAPVTAPFGTVEVARPVFPERAVSIADHGARGDGDTMNTDAFARAIAACAELGGGHVVVPPGTWLTGPIHLRSNIDLHLEEGSEVRFSTRFGDYLPVVLVWSTVQCYNYSPLVYARDCTNVAITGAGVLNGQGQVWWPWKWQDKRAPHRIHQFNVENVPLEERVLGTVEDGARPRLIHLLHCRNVLLEGVTVMDSPSWTIHPAFCDNVIARGLTVTGKGPNNDGINPESCRDVLVEHCLLDTGDDCVTIKAGKDQEAWRIGRPCENVVVRHCRAIGGHGIFVIGSEMSGGVRNIYVHDCQSDSTGRGMRIKSRRGRGGAVENIWVRDIAVGNVRQEAIEITMRYDGEPAERAVNYEQTHANSTATPVFRNLHFSNVGCGHAAVAVQIEGLPDQPVEDLTLENVVIAADRGMSIGGVKGLVLDQVVVVPREGPTLTLSDAQEVTIR
jgi:polygalacturonase